MILTIFLRPEVLPVINVKNTVVCSMTPCIWWTGATFRKNVLRPSTGVYHEEVGIVLSERRYLLTKRNMLQTKTSC